MATNLVGCSQTHASKATFRIRGIEQSISKLPIALCQEIPSLPASGPLLIRSRGLDLVVTVLFFTPVVCRGIEFLFRSSK